MSPTSRTCPRLVGGSKLVEGNAKLQASEASAQVVGPGLGGALISLVGAPFAIITDALSYLASAFFVWRIEGPEPHPEAERRAAGLAREPLRRQIAEGLGFVLRNPYLRAIAGATSSSNLFSNVTFGILPVYLYRELGLDAATVGLIFGLGALGALLGALVANQVAGRIGLGAAIIGSIALGGPANLLIPAAPHAAPVAWIMAAVALLSFTGVVYNINQVSYRQAITPIAIQARMNATMRFVVWGTIPIGAVLGGVLATAFGVHNAIWIGALGSCLPFLSVLLSPVRSLRRMPETADLSSVPVSRSRGAGPIAVDVHLAARLELGVDGTRCRRIDGERPGSATDPATHATARAEADVRVADTVRLVRAEIGPAEMTHELAADLPAIGQVSGPGDVHQLALGVLRRCAAQGTRCVDQAVGGLAARRSADRDVETVALRSGW